MQRGLPLGTRKRKKALGHKGSTPLKSRFVVVVAVVTFVVLLSR